MIFTLPGALLHSGPGAMPCLTYYAIAYKIIAEKADCSQSAVWKHVTGKGTERGNVVRKGAQATGMPLEDGQKRWIQTLKQCIKSHHAQKSSEKGLQLHS